MKLIRPQAVVEATRQLGYPGSMIPILGMVLIASTILYLVPRTSILGAILLTAYLGGAVASHARIGAPLFNVIFAVIFCVLLWGGIWLRDSDLRKLLPIRGR